MSSIKLTEPIMVCSCTALWDIYTPAVGLFCPPELKWSLFRPHIPSLLIFPSWAPETDFVTHLHDLPPTNSAGMVQFLRHLILTTCTAVQCQKSMNKWFLNTVLSVQWCIPTFTDQYNLSPPPHPPPKKTHTHTKLHKSKNWAL